MKILTLFLVLILLPLQVLASPPRARQPLRHNRGAVSLLEQEIASTERGTPGEQALIRGTLWLLRFIDRDVHFRFVFTDTIRTLENISLSMKARPESRKGNSFYFLQTIAKRVLTASLARAADHLDYYFTRDSEGAFSFMELGSVLTKEHVSSLRGTYTNFYKAYFPKQKHLFYNRSFFQALYIRDYRLLSNYIVESSFPYHVSNGSAVISTPDVHFSKYIEALSEVPFHTPGDKSKLIQLQKHNFVCQLILALSNYGRKPLQHTPLTDRLRAYLLQVFPMIYESAGETILLADATNALLTLGLTTHPYTMEGVNKLIRDQHTNGSWGTLDRLSRDPYDHFHTTTAVLSALAHAGRKGLILRKERNSP